MLRVRGNANFAEKNLMATENSKNEKNASRVAFSNREYLGFATYARGNDGQWRLHFNWRRILFVLVALGVAGYLALAFLLFCWFRYKHEWEQTSYAAMLVYPFSAETRAEMRRNIGDKIVRDAKENFQVDKDFGAYFQNIRAGLIYSPRNSDAIVDFSSMLFYQRRLREAFELLESGLPYALNHKNYIQFFVRQHLDLAQDEELCFAADALLPLFPLAEKLLPEPNALQDNRLIFVVGAAQASLLRGQFRTSRDFLTRYGVENTLSGRVLEAQLDWETGDRENALEILRSAASRVPGNEQISTLYALYLRESGDVSAARNVLTRLALMKNDPAVRVRIIALFPGDENRLYRERLEKDFFDRYKDDSAALLVFAQYATDAGNFALVKKIYDHAQNKALIDLPKFELLYLESLVLDGKSAEALKILDGLENGDYAWVKNYRGVIDCLRALAYFSSGQANLGRISMDRVIKNNTLPVARLIVLARRLDALGFEAEARSVYENAYLLENGNQTVLLELVNYALKHEDVSVLMRYLPPLLDTRRPPRAVLEKVMNFLGSDRMLFVATRRSLFEEVDRMLRESESDRIADPDETTLKSWF